MMTRRTSDVKQLSRSIYYEDESKSQITHISDMGISHATHSNPDASTITPDLASDDGMVDMDMDESSVDGDVDDHEEAEAEPDRNLYDYKDDDDDESRLSSVMDMSE